MKKIAVILIALLAIATLLTFILVPNVVERTHKVKLYADYQAIERRLTDTANWKEWWPEPQSYPSFAGVSYIPGERKAGSFAVSANNGSISVASFIRIRNEGHDSTSIEWVSIYPTSYNPFTRVKRYLEGKKIAEQSELLTDHLATHFSTMENLYGLHVDEMTVRDSLLVVTAQTTDSFPGIPAIYKMIEQLRTHVKNSGATETAPPMVNVSQLQPGEIVTRVAIPVDKPISQTSNIEFKRMLANGHMLQTRVKGGVKEVNKALENMRVFVEDQKRTAPAIPYQSWVTDRMANPDSTHWITEIYYPVM